MQEDKIKTDPRVQRTRQLILDAFHSLVPNKDLKDITVGDITKRATINRATFYAHYADKYELMDDAFAHMFKGSLMQKLSCHAELNRETLTAIIVTLCDFHMSFSTQCQRSYESMSPYIESKVTEMLHGVFELLLGQKERLDEETARTMSGMLSWSVYGITKSWNKEGRKVTPERLAEQAIAGLLAAVREIDGSTIGAMNGK
ncbi:TetR/AcrR family transcriptional regulator [Cohnella sp. JJ-181]|uniref:TetR/AcrR family transcriptional regulator n=1 Tax=Cohnella rhizoplanae TaxID=2974897 RepID=UPI0022FFB5D3|nr:TetR/AcrR family transcriptional regulator [Cohnella sp. JJ-181]CAI6082747.1 hypothetical protein COHCIP112018_03747 [Cohnella sp. JJ-181]